MRPHTARREPITGVSGVRCDIFLGMGADTYHAIARDGTPRTFHDRREYLSFLATNPGARGCMDPLAWVNAHRRAEGLPEVRTPSRWHQKTLDLAELQGVAEIIRRPTAREIWQAQQGKPARRRQGRKGP